MIYIFASSPDSGAKKKEVVIDLFFYLLDFSIDSIL